MKDLSIIIVNFNSNKLLEACLASIYKNTHKISFEITVVDNASSDGSQEMIKTKFPQVYLIENKENIGFSRANNLGLKNCQARYALLLNNDTIVKNGTLDIMTAFMDKSPKAGAVGPKLLNIDGSIQRQGGLLGKKFWLAKKPATVNFVIGAALMVRKDIIDLVGLLDENLFFYNEDLDWCIRIKKTGWHIYFLPQAEVIHYGSGSSQKEFNQRLFVEGFKGGLYFCRKHYGELAYNIYRFLLGLCLCLVLPFQIINPAKFTAYLEIISASWRGQITKPVLK